jgi:hypothetical protein
MAYEGDVRSMGSPLRSGELVDEGRDPVEGDVEVGL